MQTGSCAQIAPVFEATELAGLRQGRNAGGVTDTAGSP